MKQQSVLRKKLMLGLSAFCIAGMVMNAGPAHASGTVFIPQILELSGPGAISGTNFHDGASMAIQEINAAGGILGEQISTTVLDTQSDPSVARAQMQSVLDNNPYVILGPIFTGSCQSTMPIAQQAQIPQMIGGLGANLTEEGDQYVFRTSLSQADEMPEIIDYLANKLHAKKISIIWVNNDFGKGGRDAFDAAAKKRGLQVVADIPVEQNLQDYSAPLAQVTEAKPDAVFVYLNEGGSARLLIKAGHDGNKIPIVGDTTLLGAKVVQLAGSAANNIKGFVDLSVDMPVPGIKKFDTDFTKKYGYTPDENAIKGYTAVYTIRYVATKVGNFNSQDFAKALHGMTITPAEVPQIFLSSTWSDKGGLARPGFFAQIDNGKQNIIATLPKLGN